MLPRIFECCQMNSVTQFIIDAIRDSEKFLNGREYCLGLSGVTITCQKYGACWGFETASCRQGEQFNKTMVSFEIILRPQDDETAHEDNCIDAFEKLSGCKSADEQGREALRTSSSNSFNTSTYCRSRAVCSPNCLYSINLSPPGPSAPLTGGLGCLCRS